MANHDRSPSVCQLWTNRSKMAAHEIFVFVCAGNVGQWGQYTTGPYRNVPIQGGDHYFVSTHYQVQSAHYQGDGMSRLMHQYPFWLVCCCQGCGLHAPAAIRVSIAAISSTASSIHSDGGRGPTC